eukprot:1161864-Pelagomonas_calceolata.AAC.2
MTNDDSKDELLSFAVLFKKTGNFESEGMDPISTTCSTDKAITKSVQKQGNGSGSSLTQNHNPC